MSLLILWPHGVIDNWFSFIYNANKSIILGFGRLPSGIPTRICPQKLTVNKKKTIIKHVGVNIVISKDSINLDWFNFLKI